MLFPEVKAAAAQGVHSGYTYSQRICQEYGQQPRWYNVRDEIAGSDWRSNGGWAIIRDGGSGTRTVLEVYGEIIYSGGSGYVIDPARVITNAYGTRAAYVTLDINGQPNIYAIVDQNRDRIIDNRDLIDHNDNGVANRYVQFRWRETTVAGGAYIRWAYMRFCR